MRSKAVSMDKKGVYEKEFHLIPKGSLFKSQLNESKYAEIVEYTNDSNVGSAVARLCVITKYLFSRRTKVYFH